MITLDEFDRKYEIIDSVTPRHTYLSGRYKRTFAYQTLRERLPVFLTQIIDGMTKGKDEIVAKYGEESREEIKSVVGQLSKLKYQLQTDKPLETFNHDEPDKEIWNNFINSLPKDANTFYRTVWLYAETYMYRKASSFLEATDFLQSYDYFAKQKENSAEISTDTMIEVTRGTQGVGRDQLAFEHFLKLNLWSNQCDLSISNGNEVKPSDNIFENIGKLNAKLLVDNSSSVWNCLISADQTKPIIVDIVLDNAGFELYTDLLFAEYLIEKQLATKVRFNAKAIPWFISDVNQRDFAWMLDFTQRHTLLPIAEKGRKWKQLIDEGKFELAPIHYFWISPYGYHKMKEISPDLYKRIGEAQLVILKGDLNYRKLLDDFCWDPTDDFRTCLRGFLPTNVCSLRTIKADLICGLPEGCAEKLDKINPNWMLTGEYAIIQFAEKIESNN